jgi:NADH-quinone oxidoreductase subunit A
MALEDAYLVDLLYVMAFCFGGLLFAAGPFLVAGLLSPRETRQAAHKTDQFIECGMDPIGDAWIRYSAVYYLYALIFVAFTVDVLFLIPVAIVYDQQFAYRDLVELVLFVGVLSLVIVYAWKKGVFAWNRKSIAPQS